MTEKLGALPAKDGYPWNGHRVAYDASDDVRDIRLHKPRPRVLDKRDAAREAETLKRRIYAEVDRRDGKRCRCCGRRGNPEATTTLGRIHRAHIQDASRGGALSIENLISLCWICHALEHTPQFHFGGTNANDLGFTFEIHEAAVIDVFGTKPLPAHVRIITDRRG